VLQQVIGVYLEIRMSCSSISMQYFSDALIYHPHHTLWSKGIYVENIDEMCKMLPATNLLIQLMPTAN